ncbi:MAG TPA: hypothetical protein ENN67_08820, partial [Firmicutes bacterium]|nr:hypothetical protein [Bacillota bacterium]
MNGRFIQTILTALLILTLGSCSQKQDFSPLDPNLTSSAEISRPASSTQLWGLYEIAIDPSGSSAEIVPMRTSQFTCNVIVFMQPPLGSTTNMGIQVMDVSKFATEGFIDVDVRLTHPFPGLALYTGFDVMGVFIHNGDKTGIYDGNIRYATGIDSAVLLNADGYTRWYNPVEFLQPNILGFVEGALGTKGAGFNATLNPFKYYCDSLASTQDATEFFQVPANVANRGLYSPSTNVRRYELKFPFVGGAPEAKFQYAIVASWELPLVNPPLDIPNDFPIEANRAEAILLSVEDNDSTLWWEDGMGGGNVKIRAELWDWGSMVNPAGIIGEIGNVIVESNDVDLGAPYLVLTPAEIEPFLSEGTAASSVAMLEFTDVTPLHDGEATFLITIESSDPNSYEQGFGVPIPDAPLASYFFFTLPVGPKIPCTPPVVSLEAPDLGIAGEEIEFDASATTGTPPIQFHWDWDGDGTYDEITDSAIVTHAFPPGTWYVGLKAENDCGESVLDPPHEIEITCPDEVHDTLMHIVSCQGTFTSIRQDGTAFLPDGRIIVKNNNQLVAYEVTDPGSVPGEVIINSLANAYGAWCYFANLDYDEVLDRIIYTTIPNEVERINVYEGDGTFFTSFVIPGTGGVISGLDTDGEGGIWCIYHTPAGQSGTNTLYHYAWNSSTNSYELQTQDTFDCTFIENGARGIYDIAIM